MKARLLVINGGLLGAHTFGTRLLPRVAPHAPGLEIHQIMLTSPLSLRERVIRRAVCQRCWTDRWAGYRNLDFARYRMEVHAGLVAARRLRVRPRDSYDALLFYRTPSAYASLRRMRRVPSIVAIDSTQACIQGELTSRLERVSLRPNVRRDGRVFDAARLVLASSRWAAGSLREMYAGCRTPVEVLPPLVDLDAFAPEWIDERAARASSGANPRMLFIGGEFPRKGGFELLHAWRQAGLDAVASLDIVTGWPLDPRDLPPGVTVHRGVSAYSDRWRELWRASDVFVMPTAHEAFANVYLEAAAAGLPRVGTREHATPEVISDGATGFLLDRGDRQGLIARLRALASRPELRLSLGAAAREWAVREASPQCYAAALERAVRRVLEPVETVA